MRRGPTSHGRPSRAEPLANPARVNEGDVMRTLRLSIAGAAALLCLALAGIPALAAEEAPAGVTIVTGNEGCQEPTPGIWHETPWGGYVRGDAHWCEDTMSDPRVSGSWFETYNYDCYGVQEEQALCVFCGTRVLDGPDESLRTLALGILNRAAHCILRMVFSYAYL